MSGGKFGRGTRRKIGKAFKKSRNFVQKARKSKAGTLAENYAVKRSGMGDEEKALLASTRRS